MSDLLNKKCQVCEGGIPPLTKNEAIKLMTQVPDWTLINDGGSIERKMKFKGFYKTMSVLNAIAFIAQSEGHHPDMEVGYNYLNIRFTTHAINGLSDNDFICAAKINALLS